MSYQKMLRLKEVLRAEKRQQFGNQGEAVTGKREDKTHMKMITNQEINTEFWLRQVLILRQIL